MKNKLLVGGLLTTMLFTNAPVVDAMGTASVEFTGNNNITVGDAFTVYMNVTNIKDTYDGVVSLGGRLSFDETKLEYISSKGVEAPYLFQMNEDCYKIAGLDFTLDNGIRETLTVYEFTFKALEEGNTTITLNEAKLTDSKDYIDTTVIAKEITIEKEEIIETTPILEEKIETSKKEEIKTNEVVEVKEEIKEEKTEIIEEPKEEVTENIESVTNEEIETVFEPVEEESLIERIQKVITDLVTALSKLFK